MATTGIGPVDALVQGMMQLPLACAPSRSMWVATTGFIGSLLILAALAKDQPGLSAAGQVNGGDLDRDGLSDLQEQLLGTLANRSDSDGDGFSDLEEYARGSDPLDSLALPQASEFSMTMGAVQDGNTVMVLATVFAEQSKVGSLSLQFGVVYQGQILPIQPSSFGSPRGLRVRASNAQDRLTVVEFPVPLALVRRIGQVNVVGLLRDTSTVPADPVAGILPLVNFSGITAAVEQTPATLSFNGAGRPAGIVYRPLAPSNQLPSTWTGGQVCFQRTAAVGTSGVSIVFEIEAAGCDAMDTYCSSTNCMAGVGRSIQLPDPAALIGG